LKFGDGSEVERYGVRSVRGGEFKPDKSTMKGVFWGEITTDTKLQSGKGIRIESGGSLSYVHIGYFKSDGYGPGPYIIVDLENEFLDVGEMSINDDLRKHYVGTRYHHSGASGEFDFSQD
jgi:hypothetical protein